MKKVIPNYIKNMSVGYVMCILTKKFNVSRDMIPLEAIELKRRQIRIRRMRKKLRAINICFGCGIKKDASEFDQKTKSLNCKDCRNREQKEWRDQDKEHGRKWRKEHYRLLRTAKPEKYKKLLKEQRERARLFRARHREEILLFHRTRIKELGDGYVKDSIVKMFKVGVRMIPPEAIELRRRQLIIRRTLIKAKGVRHG